LYAALLIPRNWQQTFVKYWVHIFSMHENVLSVNEKYYSTALALEFTVILSEQGLSEKTAPEHDKLHKFAE
jgi:hypothetical protein